MRYYEYCVIPLVFTTPAEDRLNVLGAHGWQLVAATPYELILMREIPG